MQLHRLSLAILTLSTLGLGGCSLDGEDISANITSAVPTNDTIALTDLGQLISFNRVDPANTLLSVRAITGLKADDALVAIDYRPSTGELYGLGQKGNLYVMNAGNGVAKFKVALAADPTDTSNPFTVINGDPTKIGMAFNPVSEQLRVFTDKGQNLRVNVDSGAVVTDADLSTSLTLSGAAYTNSSPDSASTRLFAIDSVGFCLREVRLSDFNVGTCQRLTLNTGTQISFKDMLGFEIDGINNVGYAMLKVNNQVGMYQLDLSTLGAATGIATKKLGSSFRFDLTSAADRFNIRSIATKPNDLAYGLTADNQIVSFAPDVANKTNIITISGLVEADKGEKIVGFDRRVEDRAAAPGISDDSGVVYAISNKSYLYRLNVLTGVASDKITLIPATVNGQKDVFTSLNGTRFAVDFNPVADRLRVISDTGQNLSIDVDGGFVTTQTPINGVANADIRAAAYTNSFRNAGQGTTTLFNLDSVGQQLLTQTPPASGTLSVVGGFGKDVGNTLAFDIAGNSNEWALMTARTASNTNLLYRVNLLNGSVQPYRLTGDREALSTIGDDKTPALIDLMLVAQTIN